MREFCGNGRGYLPLEAFRVDQTKPSTSANEIVVGFMEVTEASQRPIRASCRGARLLRQAEWRACRHCPAVSSNPWRGSNGGYQAVAWRNAERLACKGHAELGCVKHALHSGATNARAGPPEVPGDCGRRC